MIRYFDTHAHYNNEEYELDRDEVLKKCFDKNVEYILNASYNIESSKISVDLSKQYDQLYCSIGIHPHDIEKEDTQEILKIYQQNKSDKIVAIGEIGLDYAFVKDNKEAQIKSFCEQIEIADYLKLPVIIHSRDASKDTFDVLTKLKKPKNNILMHCFQPSDDLVNMVLKNDYTVAFGGNITFPRNETFKRYIDIIPIENIVVETDCPYLSPVPHRGKRNSSENLDIIVNKLAEFKGLDPEFCAKIVFENSVKFFGIDQNKY